MSDFCNVLRELRLKHKFTQEELAKKLGISKSTISMYENGNREPDFETLEAIADIFNVDMNYLYGRTGEECEPYYADKETDDLYNDMHENADLRFLLSASRKLKKDDLRALAEIAIRMRGSKD